MRGGRGGMSAQQARGDMMCSADGGCGRRWDAEAMQLKEGRLGVCVRVCVCVDVALVGSPSRDVPPPRRRRCCQYTKHRHTHGWHHRQARSSTPQRT